MKKLRLLLHSELLNPYNIIQTRRKTGSTKSAGYSTGS
ncbi:hypothetical protein CHK_1363 [Christensenella hongkongensis]|uniref:Uncharacterized protein n=1 Tax=Christensenella hongkongensis TaxID=270498 RepID=A0A0M2NJ29_9FIRM|nr:hypothetical protein CHK_1363 [Christensenella hongkongensis]